MSEEPVVDQTQNRMYRLDYEKLRSSYRNCIYNGKLLFKFDPERGLIEIQQRGEKILIDLALLASQ